MIVSSIIDSVGKTAFHASPAVFLPQMTSVVSESSSFSLMTSLLVMGGASQLVVDRFKLRLDGLHTYGVISSLLMNGSLRLFSSTPKRFDQKQRFNNIIKVLFSITATISIISGSYTTIVFSLLGLYAKRALGRGMDAETLEFFEQTTSIRDLGYDTFLASLITFQISFALSLFLNHDEGLNWKLALFAGILGVACWYKWSTVMQLANTILRLTD
jgi:hypothetical protein